ncbi:MAG: hypothetical protein HYY76_02735 [Acidobacteria bacterium]|nr:hypothetical protein [Acidobacteriota bacterium]
MTSSRPGLSLPAFDPYDYEMGRTHGNQNLTVANFVAFFIGGMEGNDVVGRMVPMTGLIRDTPSPNAYLRVIRLVE